MCLFNITLSKLKVSGAHAPIGSTVDMPLLWSLSGSNVSNGKTSIFDTVTAKKIFIANAVVNNYQIDLDYLDATCNTWLCYLAFYQLQIQLQSHKSNKTNLASLLGKMVSKIFSDDGNPLFNHHPQQINMSICTLKFIHQS